MTRMGGQYTEETDNLKDQGINGRIILKLFLKNQVREEQGMLHVLGEESPQEGDETFHAHRRTNMIKLTVSFRNSANALNPLALEQGI